MDKSTPAAHLIDEDLQLDTPLWQFALRAWQNPGIAGLCLQLQAAGWSVTRLLCASWLAGEGRRYSPEALRVTAWRTAMTGPLRALRQSLLKQSASTAALRAKLADAELEAERIELALAYADMAIQTGTGNDAFAHQPREQRLQANLTSAGPEATAIDETTQDMIQTLSRQLARQFDTATETAT